MTSSVILPVELEEELRRIAEQRQTSVDESCREQLAAIPLDLALEVTRSIRQGQPIGKLASYLRVVIDRKQQGRTGATGGSSLFRIPEVKPLQSGGASTPVTKEHAGRAEQVDSKLSGRVGAALNHICRSRNKTPTDEVRKLLAAVEEEVATRVLVLAEEKLKGSDSLYELIAELLEQEDPVRRSNGADQIPCSDGRAGESQRSVWQVFGHIRRVLENVWLWMRSLRRVPFRRARFVDQDLRPDDPKQALGQLDFWKRSLVLQITGNNPEYLNLFGPEVLEEFRKVPHCEEEAVLCRLAADRGIPRPPDMTKQYWQKKTDQLRVPECSIDQLGHCTYKGRSPVAAGNALLRALGEDRILIVKFDDVPNGAKHSQYNKVLQDGIYLGLRHYQYFIHKETGKGNSVGESDKPKRGRVKCYFVCLNSSAAVDENVSFMNISNIPDLRTYFCHIHKTETIPKFIARLQLLLTKTIRAGIDLSDVDVLEREDIKCLDSEGRESCPTDGAGLISLDLAERLGTEILEGQSLRGRSRPGDELAILSQIRLFDRGMAVKGTLLAVRNVKEVGPKTILCRKSMIKVHKDDTLGCQPAFSSLELVNTTRKPKEASLSKNLIMLLSLGKVPDAYFIKLAQMSIENLKRQYSELKSVKKEVMSMSGGMNLVDETSRMLAAGMDPAKDFMLRDNLNKIAKWKFQDFHRGRFPMPKSWYLMGTADPTKTLQHGQVALLLDEGPISCEGVLVYRNPGLHPGDIRVKEATWNPALEAALPVIRKNVVIFSTVGHRSAPEEIARGDLDGDLYWVCINPEEVASTLTSYFEQSRPWLQKKPSAESQRKPSELSPTELEEELHNRFLEARFSSRNSIGCAASNYSMHMDYFLTLKDDQQKERTEHILNEIVAIHQEAVDEEKTGKKIDFPAHLVAKRVPHYLQDRRGEVYHSTSVIGQMYDLLDSPESSLSSRKTVSVDPDFEYGDFEDYTQTWEHHYQEYLRKMTTILRRNSVSKEKECEDLFSHYRQVLYGHGAESLKETKKPLRTVLSEASAIYNVVYSQALMRDMKNESMPDDPKVRKRDPPGKFAWSVALHALCTIYAEKQPGQPVVHVFGSTRQKISLHD